MKLPHLLAVVRRPIPAFLAAALLSLGQGTLAQGPNAQGPTAQGAAAVIHPELASSLEPMVGLEQGWRDPPTVARIHCWWWWLNGYATKQAITRDLEAMRDKGFGGANLIDAAHASGGHAGEKPPHGPDFGSHEWRELFVHALREADRLGLEIGLNIQSGWNLGGPTVTPEQASKKIVWSELVLDGGEPINVRLAKPDSKGGLYRDVKTVALRMPDHPGRTLARVANYRKKAYHEYPGGFTAVDASGLVDPSERPRAGAEVRPEDVVNLSDKLNNGRLAWNAPAGRWLVLRFGYTLSGAKVSTSSDNWDGWAIDYLDRSAFDQYCDDVLSPILDAAGPLVGKSLRFLHTDSWELGPVNWTPAMPEEFVARRGYDLTPYLPTLAGYEVGGREGSTRFLNDFRRTIADLIADGKYRGFSEYAHARGLGIHPESGGPHAAPVDSLLNLGQSDIPMGEFWARSQTHRVQDEARLFIKQPASAAHIYGRRVVMAEAFTTIGPHWEKSPRDLKPDFDGVACEGLNLVMWHTFDCSPEDQGLPGIAYFAGTHLNPNVTWWDQADGFLGYLNRCQFLLQQGLPVADVLYFYGENVPSFVRLKRDDPAGVQPHFDYDVINLEALCDRARAEEGHVVLPDGVRYRALVLPPDGHYGLKALEHVARLADGGALVLGEKPTTPFGLVTDEQARRFTELADRLWSGAIKPTADVAAALREHGVEPDFTAEPLRGEARLDYFHRRTSDADIYFVSNRSETGADALCSFRVSQKLPEIWDPVTGASAPAAAYSQTAGRTLVPLRLAPGGAAFVVFRKPIAADAAGQQDANWPTLTPGEPLAGPWRAAFQHGDFGPGEVVFKELTDWTDSSDPRLRYYSGAAVYRTIFEATAKQASGGPAWIDLGEVGSMARVRLNGVDLGGAWTPPQRVEATEALREGVNELEIEVVNLWHNRLVGDADLPPASRLTRTNIKHIRGDALLIPSGLRGPVRLMTGSPGRLNSLAHDEWPAVEGVDVPQSRQRPAASIIVR